MRGPAEAQRITALSGRVFEQFLARDDIPAIAPLKPDPCKRTTPERTYVDADAVQLFVGFGGDAVPMDDHLAVVADMIEEFVANPSQIGQRLPLQRHAGTNAGVNERIVADLHDIFAPAQ